MKNKKEFQSKLSFWFGMLIFLFAVISTTIYVEHSLFHDDFMRTSISSSDVKRMETFLSKLENEHKILKGMIIDFESMLVNSTLGQLPSKGTAMHDIHVKKIKSLEKLSESQRKALLNDKKIEIEKPISPLPIPISFKSKRESSNEILIVGGTDGSGTRRVVQILTQIGVKMVSEDPETYDIHADILGGWPPVVNDVLKHTKSLNYNPHDLPAHLYRKTKSSLQRLIDKAVIDSRKPTSYQLAVGGALPNPIGIASSSISFGFKAPVAMTLSPWWAEVIPNFKLLHVLRDGRDIAFSANQGPVEKFYNIMYAGAGLTKETGPLKAIRLWSDWNAGIYKWAKEYSSKEIDDKSFGYFAIHSEDIISPDIGTRFAALYNLVKWVNSNMTDDEICCLAVKDSEFMGSHDRSNGIAGNEIAHRYGKWHNFVKNDNALSNSLHSIGQEGLKVFGYEPTRALAGENVITASGYQCSLDNIAVCSSADDKELESKVAPNHEWGGDKICKVYRGVDFKGGDLNTMIMEGADFSVCCSTCVRTVGCRHFTIDPLSKVCYMKGSRGKVAMGDQSQYLYSGDVL